VADQAGVREVVVVGLAVVVVVLGAAALTFLAPEGVRRAVFETPVAIAVLIGGTALVLWRITRRPRA
jgi:hypothetical protein